MHVRDARTTAETDQDVVPRVGAPTAGSSGSQKISARTGKVATLVAGYKQYWADGCRALGLLETDDGLRFHNATTAALPSNTVLHAPPLPPPTTAGETST